MTKAFLKFTIICAASSMIAVSAWAQPGSENQPVSSLSNSQNNQSWSTKRLSATGRSEDRAVRASKLIGAQVSDSSGHHVGQIQDVIANASSGQIDFALLSLNASTSASTSSNSSYGYKPGSENSATADSGDKLFPVPWALLRASSSSQYSNAEAGQPAFTLNADQNKLNNAPKVDWSDLNQSQWRQRIYAYYGVTPESATGAAESPQGQIIKRRIAGAIHSQFGKCPRRTHEVQFDEIASALR